MAPIKNSLRALKSPARKAKRSPKKCDFVKSVPSGNNIFMQRCAYRIMMAFVTKSGSVNDIVYTKPHLDFLEQIITNKI